MPRTKYTQIASCAISAHRNLVISETDRGGYTMAQQVEIVDYDKPTRLFMKGATYIATLDALRDVRDMFIKAVEAVESDDDISWDDVMTPEDKAEIPEEVND